MNVLLTGGAGYIGSHTSFSLIDEGHNVTINGKNTFKFILIFRRRN